jgi:hypothetical protein
MTMLWQAFEKVAIGPERKSKVMSEKEKELTAYHEAGHAVVGHVLPDSDMVHKVTIIPRGPPAALPGSSRQKIKATTALLNIKTCWPGCWAAGLPKNWSMATTGLRPAPAATCKKPPSWPAIWWY